MTQESHDGPIRRYCRAAASKHGYRGAELNARVREIDATIDAMDREKPGLRLRIAGKLADGNLAGSTEHEAIQWAIMSVVEGKRADGPRKREESIGHEVLNHPDPDADPSQIVEDDERLALSRDAVKSALNALPDRERTILGMIYWERKSQATVSRELGIPVSTISDIHEKTRKSLAYKLRHLRELYTPGR